jgi:hypothetical protein
MAAGLVKPVDEDTDRAMYELAIDELAAAGTEQYEISNFARRGFECRHYRGIRRPGGRQPGEKGIRWSTGRTWRPCSTPSIPFRTP